MTRINASLNPKYLTDEQILAEHRGIKRIPWFLSRALYLNCERTVLDSVPESFILKEGHIKFFYDKQEFLVKRYQLIYQECLNRGFNVIDLSGSWDKVRSLAPRFWQDWEPTDEDNEEVLERIKFKICKSKKEYFHYYHKRISKLEAVKYLNLSILKE